MEVSEKFYRPSEMDLLVGDFSKAQKIFSWTPKIRFKELVQLMVEADLKKSGEKVKR